MRNFFKENRPGVIQSLIASVLFLLIFEPLIHIARDVAYKGLTGLVDYFYYSCAQVNGIGFVSYLALFAILCFGLDTIQHFFPAASAQAKKAKSTEINQSTDANLSIQDSEKNLKDIEIEIDKLRKQKSRAERVLRIISQILIVFWILFLCYIFIYQHLPAVANETFNRKIVQITPYVETSEVDLLKSEWVSMESKDDYDRIVEKINNILSEHNLK